MKHFTRLIALLSLSTAASADNSLYGTWVQRTAAPMTMTVEDAGGSTRFTYTLAPGSTPNFVLSFQTQFDGKESIVMADGKPSGQTMAIKRIDDRHTVAVLKFQGKDTGISKSEVSADGKVLKVDSENAEPGANGMTGSYTQYWDKE